jgi:hypothetical protein
MPTTEAQRRASKRWVEKNKESHKETCKKYREDNLEEYNRKSLIRATAYYYKNREAILEKNRMKYLKKIEERNHLADLYHANCKEDDPLTDSMSLDSSDSTISNLTDWSTVVTELPQSEPKLEPKPEHLGKTIFVHPLFKL